MAPKTETPRLKDIYPEAFGTAVEDAVENHLFSLAFSLGMRAVADGISNLRYSARDLAAYAVEGARLDAPVEEYLISVCPPVWTRAADAGGYQTPEFDNANIDALPSGWLGELILVMRAALAREAIEQGQDVGPADLAALASISSTQARALLRSGEIVGGMIDDGWEVSAEEARRWLAARGVPGFGRGK